MEFDKQNFLIFDSSSSKDSEKQFSNDNKNFEEFTLSLHKAEELLERTDLNRSITWMLTHKPLWTGAYMVHPFYYDED